MRSYLQEFLERYKTKCNCSEVRTYTGEAQSKYEILTQLGKETFHQYGGWTRSTTAEFPQIILNNGEKLELRAVRFPVDSATFKASVSVGQLMIALSATNVTRIRPANSGRSAHDIHWKDLVGKVQDGRDLNFYIEQNGGINWDAIDAEVMLAKMKEREA